MLSCYTSRSVPYPVNIRKASSGSRWEQIQRLTARHYVERESNWRSPSNPSTQSSRNAAEEEVERAGGDGGHQENKAL